MIGCGTSYRFKVDEDEMEFVAATTLVQATRVKGYGSSWSLEFENGIVVSIDDDFNKTPKQFTIGTPWEVWRDKKGRFRFRKIEEMRRKP